MPKPPLTTLLVFAFALIFTACSSDEYDILKGNVTDIVGPESIPIDTPFELEVIFSGGTDGCAAADHLEHTKTDTSFQIVAYYRYPRGEQICTMHIPTHKLNLSCTLTQPGEHVFMTEHGEVMHTVVATK